MLRCDKYTERTDKNELYTMLIKAISAITITIKKFHYNDRYKLQTVSVFVKFYIVLKRVLRFICYALQIVSSNFEYSKAI